MLEKIKSYLKIENTFCDTKGALQELIKNDILSRNDNILYTKIINSGKNLKDSVEYCYNEYLQEYIKQHGQVNGGVGGCDSDIVAMAIHYFDEDSIQKYSKEQTKKEKENKEDKEKTIPVKTISKPAKKVTESTISKNQATLFDTDKKEENKEKFSFGSLFDID